MDFRHDQDWQDSNAPKRTKGYSIFLAVCMVIGIILGIYFDEMRLTGAMTIGLAGVIILYFRDKNNTLDGP